MSLISSLRPLAAVLGLALIAALCTLPASAETRVEGTLKGETTWSKQGSPYIVVGDIIVPKGSKLTIDPGVTVRFKANIATMTGLNAFDLELLVHGTLTATGAEGDTVYFTSDSDKPRWGDWQGIIAKGEGSTVDLRAVKLEYANEGVKVFSDGMLKAKDLTIERCANSGIYFLGGKGELDNVLVTQVGVPGGTSIGINHDRGAVAHIKNSLVVGAQNGISYSRGSSGTLTDSVVSMCAARGIIIRNSNPTLEGCTITNNDYGLIVSAGAKPVVKRNNIFQNNTADLKLQDYRKEPIKLDFSDNWWGITTLGIIEDRILDGVDDPKVKAFAIIEPVLEEATTPQQKR